MTFDFAPGWLDGLSGTAEYAAPAVPRSVRMDGLNSGLRRPPPAAPRAPAHPTVAEMAELVEELFSEGSLSFEQLCSLSNVPELEPLLETTLAGVPASRRLATAKP